MTKKDTKFPKKLVSIGHQKFPPEISYRIQPIKMQTTQVINSSCLIVTSLLITEIKLFILFY
jgi:hypothetical protein